MLPRKQQGGINGWGKGTVVGLLYIQSLDSLPQGVGALPSCSWAATDVAVRLWRVMGPLVNLKDSISP